MPTRRTFKNGTFLQKAGFALVVAVFSMGVRIAIEDKLDRIGRPDPGFGLNGDFIHPTRDDAADAGLRYGGRLLAPNGQPPSATWSWLDVRPGLLMALLGIGAFLLRPWELESWALLAICCLSGGALETLYVPQGPDVIVRPLYFSALIGFVYVVPFHVALVFPKVHVWLASGTWPLRAIYTLGGALSLLSLAAYFTRGDDLERLALPLGLGTLLLAITTLVGRSAWMALCASERVVRQRAHHALGNAVRIRAARRRAVPADRAALVVTRRAARLLAARLVLLRDGAHHRAGRAVERPRCGAARGAVLGRGVRADADRRVALGAQPVGGRAAPAARAVSLAELQRAARSAPVPEARACPSSCARPGGSSLRRAAWTAC